MIVLCVRSTDRRKCRGFNEIHARLASSVLPTGVYCAQDKTGPDSGTAAQCAGQIGELIPLAKVSALLPTRPHRSTIFRWAAKGVEGVRLQSVSVGGTRCTTQQWLLEFFRAVQKARERGVPAPPKSRPVGPSRQAETAARQHTRKVLRRHGLVD